MDIEIKVARSVEDLFRAFHFPAKLLDVVSARCIASLNLGGDDARAIYEMRIGAAPRFFAVSTLEYLEDPMTEGSFIKHWTEAKDVRLLDKRNNGAGSNFLFELFTPFGIIPEE